MDRPVERMTDAEFEQWKRDNGWHFNGIDALFFLAVILIIGIVVWIS